MLIPTVDDIDLMSECIASSD